MRDCLPLFRLPNDLSLPAHVINHIHTSSRHSTRSLRSNQNSWPSFLQHRFDATNPWSDSMLPRYNRNHTSGRDGSSILPLSCDDLLPIYWKVSSRILGREPSGSGSCKWTQAPCLDTNEHEDFGIGRSSCLGSMGQRIQTCRLYHIIYVTLSVMISLKWHSPQPTTERTGMSSNNRRKKAGHIWD
jgi:hypothetical protein